MTLSSYASNVLKELAITVKTMTKSSKIDISIGEMQLAVQELQSALKSLPNDLAGTLSSALDGDAKAEHITKTTVPPIIEVLQLATLVSLLTETAARIEIIVDAIDELARLADFKPPTSKEANHSQASNKLSSSNEDLIIKQ